MKIYKCLFLVPLLLGACRDDSMRHDFEHVDGGMELRIQAEIDQLNPTRADDTGFADGDVIGVYAVDFANGIPGVLSPAGNNSDNVAFTYDDSSFRWTGTRSILFADDKTPMDLYAYYPYAKSIEDVMAYPIAVEYDQSGKSGSGNLSAYEASDFLWAKTPGVTAAAQSAILYFKHALASVRVTLLEGEGFDSGEWAKLDKSVLVSGTSRTATIDLSSGEVMPSCEKDGRSIVAKTDAGDFRAIVIPQTVNAGEQLLGITVGRNTYRFTKQTAMVYSPTKQHSFTIEVNKTYPSGDYEFSLVSEAVTPWESDIESHNGEAKEYVVVNVPASSSLEDAVKKMSLDPSDIINIKIVGELRDDDFEYIKASMLQVESINMAEVTLPEFTWFTDDGAFKNALPERAFAGMTTLRYFVFPKGLRYIGHNAFCGTGLTGSLIIPEGIEYIGRDAFRSSTDYIDYPFKNNLTGSLVLPSTLKKIAGRAFLGCEFTGSLLLPESLEEIGPDVFSGCKYFSGDLYMPDGMGYTQGYDFSGAFEGMSGLSGRIKLPMGMRTLRSSMFAGNNIEYIQWPDNLTEISKGVFSYCDFKGSFNIPSSVVSIGDYCFHNSNIKHISLPPGLSKISAECFLNCSELADTITLPDKVEIIGERAFAKCRRLEAVLLPASLKRIETFAFGWCLDLDYIRCLSVEPPVLTESVFDGVNKENVTVEVPEQSVDAYRNAPGWSEFKKIAAYRNFVARPTKYNVLNKGGKKEIILNADGDWEMTECPSWCSIDRKSGSKKTTLTLTVDAMAKGSQPREGKISFRLKDAGDHSTHISISQYDYQYDEDQYLTLQSATKGQGINLVFLGDGYDAFDISSGTYLEDMKQQAEYFFGLEPYSTYRDYFNVYTAFALSDDSGVEELNTWRNTKFHVKIGDGDTKDGQRLSADFMAALDYCALNVPPTVNRQVPQVGCILLANSEISEGVTYMGDSFCSVVTKSSRPYPDDARGIVQHEAGGHGIGLLGDEYIYHTAFINRCSCQCCKHVGELTAGQESGMFLNLSLTGNYKDVPWSHLMFNPAYSDIVDVYEGGFFHSRGVYRSEYNSCMNNDVPYFSSWSRQLIVQRIMKLAGEKFDLDSFYAKDSRATGKIFSGTSRSGIPKTDASSIRHHHAPIKITGYKFGKKGGRK